MKHITYRSLAIITSIITILLSLSLFILSDNRTSISSDGIGYYSYLPAVLIDHDLSFNTAVNRYSEYYNEDPYNFTECGEGILICDEYRGFKPQENGTWIDKYPVGVAVLTSPFFLIADTCVVLTGGIRDGISPPYQYALAISGIFYLQLGMYFTYRVLRKRFNNNISILLLIFLLLGTNLLHYAVFEPSMSHIYSFTLITLGIYLTDRYIKRPSLKLLLLLGLDMSFIGLTRNLNLIFCLIPIYLILKANKKGERIPLLLRMMILWSITTLIVFIPQIIYWYISSGNLISYGYTNETFNFLNPQIFKVLFDISSNGLFFWHPLLLLIIPGIYYAIKAKEQFGYISLIFLSILTYIFSSWWAYWFGYSFGHRAYTDYYILFLIPIGYLFKRVLNVKRSYLIIIAILISFFLLLNLIQMNNYWRGIVAGNNLTWDNYWINFFNPNIF